MRNTHIGTERRITDMQDSKDAQGISSRIKEEVQSQTCVFWVGAGISRDSGAPVAKELSNGLVRYLSKKETVLEKEIYKVLPGPNDSAPIPDHFLTPWQYAPDEIKGSEADIFVKPAQEKTFLRLETVLEAIRQNIPCMLPLLFNKFDSLKPNSNHYILASALSKGHHIITTNWDSLIEKAGNISNDNFTVKIWNANTNKVDTKVINRPRGGIYLKLHGSLEKDSSPLSFINQFTTGATPEIQSLLRKILKERLIIFLGYSFSDFFDY